MATPLMISTVLQELSEALQQRESLDMRIQDLKKASRESVLEQVRQQVSAFDITHAELTGYLQMEQKKGHRGQAARPRVSGARTDTGKRGAPRPESTRPPSRASVKRAAAQKKG